MRPGRRKLTRSLREARLILWALLHKSHPILAHIVPMRRCNLSCSYCNEYDKVSDPVPVAEVCRRIDRLAALGTSIVTLSGGEPMMHPDLDTIIAHIRARGMMAGLITNGFFLGPERIRRLNEAGLDHLQISIDNVEPDEASQKSLRTLDRKLQHLSELAEFHVNVNTVLGSGVRRPEDAVIIARRAAELGFTTSVGIIHDGSGQLRPLSPREHAIYREAVAYGQGLYSRVHGFQHRLVRGEPNDWQCRAGARYLYICEFGLVHYCSQQRGYPAIPLDEYTIEDIRREFDTPKQCAPTCTIGCVHRVSSLDSWRRPQTLLSIGRRMARFRSGGSSNLSSPRGEDQPAPASDIRHAS
ncbi:MAG: radical SAM protein [Myxococcales bacterium]|nr:radical SAM protein [Myxococcota bacterium]MDW8283180.1 radical SAM protein [Myxococcales bacterium]